MNTWRLWQALNLPPVYHPLYQRLSHRRYESPWRITWMAFGGLALLLLVVFPAALLPLMLVSPLLMALFAATLNGIHWAAQIAGALAAQRRDGSFDLLAVSPEGPLNISWIFAAGRLHHNSALERARTDSNFVIQFLGLGGLALSFGMLISETPEQRLMALMAVVAVGLLVSLLYIDSVQTILTSVLIGITAGHITRSGLDSRLWSIGGFVTVQLSLYAIGLVMLIGVQGWLRGLIGSSGPLIDILIPLLLLLAFAGLREGVITVLWRRLHRLLNASPDSLEKLQQAQRIAGTFQPSAQQSELLKP